MIDAHCHIDLYKRPEDILNECEALDMTVLAMTNLPSHFEVGYPFFLERKKIRLALGMHPLYAKYHENEFPSFIRNTSKTSYIGEIGLDFSQEGIATKEIQLKTFKRLLFELTGKKKILSIHSRRAEKEVLEHLIGYQIKSAIFHWYSGSLSLISKIYSAGFFFSINPAMIRSKTGQSIISQIPMDYVLTESDGPFIQNDGEVIKPRDISLVITYLSSIWQLPQSAIQEKINSNFHRLINTIKSSDQ
ncbi:MAG: TatD family deoxyribonuclease [Chitinophagaceae bacterium]|nr:MAG: TatD family deoxyribonuclease [Chitinophagaceae bacterium]